MKGLKASKIIYNLKNKDTRILWIISPIFLSIFSIVLGILITLYPKSNYENIMFEIDYTFLDFKLYAFLFTCLVGFLLGILWTMRKKKYKTLKIVEKKISSNHFILEMIILCISLVISVSFIYSLMRSNGNLIGMLIAGMGTDFRASAASVFEVNGTQAGTFLTANIALLTWLYFQYSERSKRLSRLTRRIYGIMLTIVLLAFLISCILAQARYILMPYIVSIVYILIFFKYHENSITLMKLIKYILITFVFIIILFTFISYIRAGSGNENGNINSNNFIVGYTVAAYNRLSEIISGNLVLPNSGSSFYMLKTFWYPPFISRGYDIYTIGQTLGLNLPNSTDINFYDQFTAIKMAGLSPNYNWSTAFGGIFSDLGWFSFIYFFFYGLLSWKLYISFLNKNIFGIMLYPIFVFSILFWFGDLYIVYTNFFVIIIITLFIWFLEKIFN